MQDELTGLQTGGDVKHREHGGRLKAASDELDSRVRDEIARVASDSDDHLQAAVEKLGSRMREQLNWVLESLYGRHDRDGRWTDRSRAWAPFCGRSCRGCR